MKVRAAQLPRDPHHDPSPALRARGTFSLALAILGLVFSCSIWPFLPGQTFSAESQNLTVVSYPARPAKLPLWLAQDAGLFEKNGLKVQSKK